MTYEVFETLYSAHSVFLLFLEKYFFVRLRGGCFYSTAEYEKIRKFFCGERREREEEEKRDKKFATRECSECV